MALPMNNTPVYNLTVPSTGNVVQYRPFLIKEEKALLLAQQSEQPKVMMDTLKQVVKDCVKTEINVEELATFDLEYIFTQIRAKSVGEEVELSIRCDTCDDPKAISIIRLDLTKVEVQTGEGHNKNINLFGDTGVVMKYPSFDTISKFENLDATDINQMFDIVIDCIDYIYTTDEVFHAKEQTREDLLDFLNNLTSEQFVKIQGFFETMPKMKKDIDYKCPVCGAAHHKVLEGIASFF